MQRITIALIALLFCRGDANAGEPVGPAAPVTQRVSFVHEVEPLFTRFGCNQGACHGKGAGQNGFRLSLRGYAPELDHQWLTREFSSRRISTSVPEDSLILRKATGLAAHEGGKLFDKNSRAYKLLASWLTAGMPGPSKDDLMVTDLEIQPGSRMLKPTQQQQLVARAKFSDGHWQDVTWLTRFDSNDPGMATVDSAGLVTVLRTGETSIRASFLTQVAVTVITAPREVTLSAAERETWSKRNNFIDEHVFKKLEVLKIPASPLCTDHEFIRRAFLDTLGILPTPDEVRTFVADTSADKVRQVDRCLARTTRVCRSLVVVSERPFPEPQRARS